MKFDKDKIKLYLEDLRLFFYVHNHPEIKIIGQNLPKSLQSNLREKSNFLVQDDNYDEEDKFNIDKLRIGKEKESQTRDISKNFNASKVTNKVLESI